jgi:hypothetical protein
VLGAAIAAFGIVQIGSLTVWSTVASVSLNSMLASGAPTLHELVSPLTDSTITALPFCIVLGLVSMRARKLTAPRTPHSSAQDPMLTAPAP